MKELLKTDRLTVGYGRKVVLKSVSFELKKGEILSLIGPNGSGKSTVLNTIREELEPLEGTVFLDGKATGKFSRRELSQKMAGVLTSRVKTSMMTAREVVAMGRYSYTGALGLLGEKDEKAVGHAIRLVRAEVLADREFDRLSDGQKQRILIARAIAQEPEVLIMDEPTSYLDIRYRLELMDALRQLAKEGTAVILSIHEIDEALRLSDRVLCVSDEGDVCCLSPCGVMEEKMIQKLFALSDAAYRQQFGALEEEILRSGNVWSQNPKTFLSQDQQDRNQEGLKSQIPQDQVSGTSLNLEHENGEGETLNPQTPRSQISASSQKTDREKMKETARQYISHLAMPPGSLGRLEDLAVQISGITGKLRPNLSKKRVIVLCADNGVVKEGVSSAPQSVTVMQALNMTRGVTGMSAIAGGFGDEVQVVDVGIASPYRSDRIINHKVRPGTADIRIGPAMTRKEAETALSIGRSLAANAKEEGVGVVGVGEMGIGNTTTSAAVLAVLTGLSPDLVTGRGGGISDHAFKLKKQVIADAIAVNQPNPDDPLDVISKVGGLDLAAMCGVFLGCAEVGLPAVTDGFISVTAALLAFRINPFARDVLIPSHASTERGYRICMEELGMRPIFDLGMRLGEGSGCPLTFRVIDAVSSMMNRMASFDGAGIDDGYLAEVRSDEKFQE